MQNSICDSPVSRIESQAETGLSLSRRISCLMPKEEDGELLNIILATIFTVFILATGIVVFVWR